MHAKYRHGVQTALDWTPGTDVSAGDVIATGGALPSVVAKRDLVADELGEVCYGGVYEMIAAEPLAAFAKVQFINASGKVGAVGDVAFGYTVEAAAGDGSPVLVLHEPTT